MAHLIIGIVGVCFFGGSEDGNKRFNRRVAFRYGEMTPAQWMRATVRGHWTLSCSYCPTKPYIAIDKFIEHRMDEAQILPLVANAGTNDTSVLLALALVCVAIFGGLLCFFGGWIVRNRWYRSYRKSLRSVLERHGAPPNRIMYPVGAVVLDSLR